MRVTLIPIMFLFLIGGLRAQSDSLPPTTDPQCLLATGDEVWMSLDLTAEELEGVKALQTACETDCTTIKTDGDPRAVSGVLEKYMADVRELLGEEKYQRWVEWCGRRPVKG